MEVIASHNAKVTGSMIDRHVQVSITSKDVESMASNKRNDTSTSLDNVNTMQFENQWNAVKAQKHK